MPIVTVDVHLPPWQRGAFIASWELLSANFVTIDRGRFIGARSQDLTLPAGKYWFKVRFPDDRSAATEINVNPYSNTQKVTLYAGWMPSASTSTEEVEDSAARVKIKTFVLVDEAWVATSVKDVVHWQPHTFSCELEFSAEHLRPLAVRVETVSQLPRILIAPPSSVLRLKSLRRPDLDGELDIVDSRVLIKDETTNALARLLDVSASPNWVGSSDTLEHLIEAVPEQSRPLAEIITFYLNSTASEPLLFLSRHLSRLEALAGDLGWSADSAILAAHATLALRGDAGILAVSRYLEIAASRGYPVFYRGILLFLESWRLVRAMNVDLSESTAKAAGRYSLVRAANLGDGIFTAFSGASPSEPGNINKMTDEASDERSYKFPISDPDVLTSSDVREILRISDLQIVDFLRIPDRRADFATIPDSLHRRLQVLLANEFPNGLWAHQAQAVSLLVSGIDVCVATPTATGKSIIFQAAAAEQLLRRSDARILALYPVKALILDQKSKWEKLLGALGFSVRQIDGTIEIKDRIELLRAGQVILMTPDVLHSWVMSNLQDPDIGAFLKNLDVLILDEAHVYDGVFGTNMAFLLRRLQAVAGEFRIICSTATIDNPKNFVLKLTGRTVSVVDSHLDGAAVAPKTVLLARSSQKSAFSSALSVLRACVRVRKGRFLVFSDTRISVELLVAALHEGRSEEDLDVPEESQAGLEDSLLQDAYVAPSDIERASAFTGVLPFRAGYEKSDREKIQIALQRGVLQGVVATSALELGLDIGGIDLVVLLGYPRRMKEFWQRLGRTGRKHIGFCLILDGKNHWAKGRGSSMQSYVERPVEPSWLYFGNRYVQFANALCAARELKDSGRPFERGIYSSLPSDFVKFLEREITDEGKYPLPPDLLHVKERLRNKPQKGFPIRNSAEANFQVILRKGGRKIGTLSYAQAMREAYPGAIYYYMAKAYRVKEISQVGYEIRSEPTNSGTTKPIFQARAFPNFRTGAYHVRRSSQGFLAEVSMQVAERVSGFVEQHGRNKATYQYGANSEFSKRDFCRFVTTTGVCWYSDENTSSHADGVARLLMEAFCVRFGVESRDLGVAPVLYEGNQLGFSGGRGYAIYDATFGSLRLTEQLVYGFSDVVEIAETFLGDDSHPGVVLGLRGLRMLSSNLTVQEVSRDPNWLEYDLVPESGWVNIIAPQQAGIYVPESREVTVVDFRNTDHGLLYYIEGRRPGSLVGVLAAKVLPIDGVTKLIRVNVYTGEIAQ